MVKTKVRTAPVGIEAALRESEQRLCWLASIIDSSDNAVVSKNLDGVITSWNTGAERIFGYSASEAIGRPVTLVIPPDRQSEERDILTQIRRGQRIDHFETVRQHKQGSLIVVSLTVSPVKDANGKIFGAAKVARDITEQNQEAARAGAAAQYLVWAFEEVEKAGNQKAAQHVRTALKALGVRIPTAD
jgi:PAS domain S-box-containing protein